MRAYAHPAALPAPSVASFRRRLGDGATTTLHVAAFPPAGVAARVALLDGSESLVRWCRRTRTAHAIVGGFFVRPGNAPLGELRIGGEQLATVPFVAPWAATRACVAIDEERVTIARRSDLAKQPRGDLLQAGPLLVRDGVSAVTGRDEEGFTAAAHQFDSDISDGRYPRCALALTADSLLAIACDGRHDDDAGLSLGELADALVELGARSALNLDGGGSASLVCHGALVNRPRESHGIDLLDGRRIATALVFDSA